MTTRAGWAVLGMLAVLGAAPDGAAQYYPPPGYPPPPPGYLSPPAYPPLAYPPLAYPPSDYPPPDYYLPPRPLGERCSSRLPTAFGPRRLVCDIVRPRPLGRPCVCPPPPPAPGYPPGPYLDGRVVP